MGAQDSRDISAGADSSTAAPSSSQQQNGGDDACETAGCCAAHDPGRLEAGGPTGRLEAGGPMGRSPRWWAAASERKERFEDDIMCDDRRVWEFSKKSGLCLEDSEVLVKANYTVEMLPQTPYQLKVLLKHLRANPFGRPAAWKTISGLFEETDPGFAERRRRVRHLVEAAKLYIRLGLKARAEETGEFAEERTIYWEPIPVLCKALEISASALSRFCVELTGVNLKGVVDLVRAEAVRNQMRGEIREFLIQFKMQNSKCKIDDRIAADPSPLAPLPQGERGKDGSLRSRAGWKPAVQELEAEGLEDCSRADAWEIWKALKVSRKAPVFCRNSWAMGFGFASYNRMYRACKVLYEMTPQQMEMTLIEEALGLSEENERKECKIQNAKFKIDGGAAAPRYLMGARAEKMLAREFREWTVAELEAAIAGYRTCDDVMVEERNSKFEIHNSK